MGEATAVRVAIDLLRVPSRVRMIRDAPLPGGMDLLLRIAAGDRAAINGRHAADRAIRKTCCGRRPSSSSSRSCCHPIPTVTGCSAPTAMRRRRAAAVIWPAGPLDAPRRCRIRDRSMFAGRVTLAWDDLKTLERRVAYDVTRCRATSGNAKPNAKKAGANTKSRTKSQNGSTGSRKSAQSRSVAIYSARQPGLLRRAWLLLLGRS